jgi:urea transporter
MNGMAAEVPVLVSFVEGSKPVAVVGFLIAALTAAMVAVAASRDSLVTATLLSMILPFWLARP